LNQDATYVQPNVVEIGVGGDIIYGRAEPPEPSVDASTGGSYFILDSNGGEAWKGLGREEWQELLRPLLGPNPIELEPVTLYAKRMIAEGREWGKVDERTGQKIPGRNPRRARPRSR
jgi:hypothetical protein